MGEVLTMEQVAAWFTEWCETATKLQGIGSLGTGNCWEMILLYATNDKMPTEEEVLDALREAPNLMELARFDDVTTWLTWLDVPARKLMIDRASGATWRVLGHMHQMTAYKAQMEWQRQAKKIVRFALCGPLKYTA
jgi:hypothetical protein